MKLFFLFALSIGTFVSCTHFRGRESVRNNIQISSIEGLEFGKVLGTHMVGLLGQPDEIIHLTRDLSGKDAWLYFEEVGGHRLERLGLLVNQNSDIVQSATWSVQEGELLYKKDSALAHFKNAKFIEKKMGQVAQDYFSDDSAFTDPQSGVSFYLNGVSQTVSSISFESAVK